MQHADTQEVISTFEQAALDHGRVRALDGCDPGRLYRAADRAYLAAVTLCSLDRSRAWLAEADRWYWHRSAALDALLAHARGRAAG